MNQISKLPRLVNIVEDYDAKRADLSASISEYDSACSSLKLAATMGGKNSHEVFTRSESVHKAHLERVLLSSAWGYVYDGLNIAQIAPASDRSKFEQALTNPPEFTLDNIRATFGDYVANHWAHILRGLAEVFTRLDPAYKSHSKVKIGVKGLPKRIILNGVVGCSAYGCHGHDQVEDMFNAIRAYRKQPLIQSMYKELIDQVDEFDGCELRWFANGNLHIHFDKATLRDVNFALSEYYGDVLPDIDEGNPTKQPSTAVAKDLQYYPTPKDVAERVVAYHSFRDGEKVLEPSCGCGRILDALPPKAKATGIEYDYGRVQEAKAKGHRVVHSNFLSEEPYPVYDHVIMNPPFYGRHYQKHVLHALKFLKSERGAELSAILPSSAMYDHGFVDEVSSMDGFRAQWMDLPVGSFAESGTNVPTGILRVRKL